jgi:hypothetical protein
LMNSVNDTPELFECHGVSNRATTSVAERREPVATEWAIHTCRTAGSHSVDRFVLLFSLHPE